MFIQLTYKPAQGVRCAILLNVNQIAEVWDRTDGKGGCHIARSNEPELPISVAESFSEVHELIKGALK
jgi:hypothetical protein